MKKELKISTLSIVCVLCTTIAMPSFGASAVRSLGGVGTYSSASSAASTGTKSAGASTNTVRAGSMRVNNTKSVTGTEKAESASATRSATTPRLSIGKYLSSVGATGKPSSGSGVINPGQAGNHGVEGRVTALEEALGLGDYEGKYNGLVVDVEQMQKDLAALTGDGFVVDVDYTDGVLTITQGGKEIFSEELATESGLKDLQDKLDELSETFATKAALEETDSNLTKVQTAVAELEAVVESLDKVGSLEFEQQVAALKAVDEELTLAINGIKEIDHSKYATTEALDALSAELKGLIDKAAGGEDLSNLSDEISRLSSTLDILSEQALLNQNAIKANQDKIAALQEADKGFATMDALNEAQIALLEVINEKHASGDYLTAADLTELSNKVAALESGKADASTVSLIQETIGKLGDTYASKSELTSAEERLQAVIDNIDLTAYAKTADVNAALASKADKSELTTLATTEALNNLQLTLQAAINEKQAAGDYATTKALEELSERVTALQNGGVDSDSVVGLQNQINEITLTYATKSQLSQTEADLMAEIAKIDLTDYVLTSDLKTVAFTGNYDDLENRPDLTQYLTNEVLEQKAYLTEEKAEQTYLTESNVNQYVDIEDGSITVAKLANGAVTAEKINTGTDNAGEMVMLMSNGDGTSQWVSVDVAEEYK